MAPKGGSGKKESGRAKKDENEANKRAAAAETKACLSLHTYTFTSFLNRGAHLSLQERAEATKWTDGARPTNAKEEREEKRRAELARKAENARLLAEEEASVNKKKAAPKKKAAAKPAGPGAIAAGADAAGQVAPAVDAETPSKDGNGGEPQEIESFAATGIDNALDLAEVITAKMDKASIGNQAAAAVEKHPEVRDPHLPTIWPLHLTFGHLLAAETIQGAFSFSFCLVIPSF